MKSQAGTNTSCHSNFREVTDSEFERIVTQYGVRNESASGIRFIRAPRLRRPSLAFRELQDTAACEYE